MIELCQRRSLEAVNVYDARQFLRIDHSGEDPYIMSLIASATNWVENYLGICLLRQKYRYHWQEKESSPKTSCHVIYLPYPPILSIEEVIDTTHDYRKTIRRVSWDLKSDRPFIMVGLHHKKVEIAYFSGYGETPSHIPEDIRHAILMVVRILYDTRGKNVDLNMHPIKEVLKCYKTMKLL